MGDAAPESPCQIYLAVPANADADLVSQLLASGRIACLLSHAAGGGAPGADAAREMAAIAHGHGVPLLVARDPALARQAGADGVHIPANEAMYAQARKLLGPDAMIGAGCGLSRHDALVLAEQGSDYVAFGPEPGGDATKISDTAALTGWWREVCEPPVVAWHRGGWDEAAAIIEAGADFIGASTVIWHAETPVKALGQLSALIAKYAGKS